MKRKPYVKPVAPEYSPQAAQELEKRLRSQTDSWALYQLEPEEVREMEEKFWLYKKPPGIKKAVEVAKKRIVAVLFPKRLNPKKRS